MHQQRVIIPGSTTNISEMMPTPGKTLYATTQRGSFEARAVENVLLCREHYRLTVRVEAFGASLPGNFVQILIDPQWTANGQPWTPREMEWEPGRQPPKFHEPFLLEGRAYLRRPFSIAGRRDGADTGGKPFSDLDIIYRVIGKATQAMEKLKAGD